MWVLGTYICCYFLFLIAYTITIYDIACEAEYAELFPFSQSAKSKYKADNENVAISLVAIPKFLLIPILMQYCHMMSIVF